MRFILNNKGIILFYIALLICLQVYVWRIDRLEKHDDFYNNVILTVNQK